MKTFQRGLVLLLSFAPFAMAAVADPSRVRPKHGSQTPAPDPSVSYLYQNWSEETRADFHYRAQGSELVPYYLFLNLMEPDGTTRLKDDLRRFGMLYDNATKEVHRRNPDGLPIGFARQAEAGSYGGIVEKQWLGLTCAACHTGAIVPKPGTDALKQGTILVDGAPAKIDVAGFLTKLRDSVRATGADAKSLQDLVDRAQRSGESGTPDQIKSRFQNYASQLEDILALYLPQDHAGPGRLDCFGAIINRVCVYDIKAPQNRPSSLDAPVDFPFIWYSDRQSAIQWFGGLPNSNWVERLARNSGEVSGVFAQVETKRKATWGGYRSSLNVKGMAKLDAYVSKLKAPKWTDVFPSSDPALLTRGKTVYAQHCSTSSCHQGLAPIGKVTAVSPTPLLPDLNTDENNTRLVHSASADSGLLDGTKEYLVLGKKIGKTGQGTALVGTVVGGELLGRKGEVTEAFLGYLLSNFSLPWQWATIQAREKISPRVLSEAYKAPGRSNPDGAQKSGFDPRVDGYEARSLNGIWATAPYLHNGSVPNLEQLLWPERRERTFYAGSYVYDPEKVGYVSDGSAGGVLFDTRLSGNSSKGHLYGATLSPDDKKALIAYLKTL